MTIYTWLQLKNSNIFNILMKVNAGRGKKLIFLVAMEELWKLQAGQKSLLVRVVSVWKKSIKSVSIEKRDRVARRKGIFRFFGLNFVSVWRKIFIFEINFRISNFKGQVKN